MKNYKLSIPAPCHESWDGMAPNADGRFCGQCQKTVTDFTGMTNAQVNAYMQLNAGRKICGRFETKQLDSIIIQIPAQVMYSQSSFRKMFLLALLFSMGTTLLSCSDKEGNRQKIDEVVVIDSIEKPENLVVKDSAYVPAIKDTFSATSQRIILTGAVAIDPQDIPPPPLMGEVAMPPPTPESHLMGDTIYNPNDK